MKSFRIVIADDHQLVRDGMGLVLHDAFDGLELLFAQDAYGLEAALSGNGKLPDIAIVDLDMPGMDKGAQLSTLAAKYPELAFIVVSAMSSPDTMALALGPANVYAFVPKSADTERLSEAVEAALAKRKLVACAAWQPAAIKPPTDDPPLSPRLAEVRQLLRRGLSNKMIAAELGLSVGTVRNYLNEIYRILNVNNRTQAAFFGTPEP
jgi:DNA-binding NarL/FixJ family response regulator